jgi:DNA-binding response OmpR family regulator
MKSVTTILFVENDAVAMTMYQKRLQREGFHVETAEDGIAALKVLSEMTPDLVVLDLILPKFSGRDVFDYMRADGQFKDVPVIIFSNASRAEWPKDVETSPTRALPKSEANFAALLELIREMTAGNAAAETTPPSASPAAEPSADLQMTPGVPATDPLPDLAGDMQTAEQFLEYAIADMPVLREHCLAFIKGPATEGGRNNLSALRKRLSVLNAGAEKTGCARLSLLADAWESLLSEIERKPALISPSILQTLAQAADCLRILLNKNTVSPMEPLPKAKVLSVDDDEICNDVAVSALQQANMEADSSQDANAALALLEKNNYDLVLLDVNMPGLTGFELCEKLRDLPQHEKTPVIFVTAFNNFENRKQSVLSGGGDLIAKPVSPLELALKVTIHLLKAPPKPVVTPTASESEPAPILVWKEPAQTISHDTEMFLKGVKTLNAAPNLLASTTETSTTDPELEAEPEREAVPVAKVPEVKPAEIAEPVAALIPAGALADLQMKTVEANVLESVAMSRTPASESALVEPLKFTEPMAKASPVVPEIPSIPLSKPIEPVLPVSPALPASPALPVSNRESISASAATSDLVDEAFAAPAAPPAPVSEPVPPVSSSHEILESVPASRPLPDEGTVVIPPPPVQSSETETPKTTGSSKVKEPMKKENNPQFETLVLDVAHIIFGDNAPEINVRLVRMALEQVWQNRAELQTLDAIAKEIARIIFGETNTSDLNVRLVKMALERSNSIALFKAA